MCSKYFEYDQIQNQQNSPTIIAPISAQSIVIYQLQIIEIATRPLSSKHHFNKKIFKNKLRFQRLNEKILKNREYIVIKCHNTPGDNDSGSYEINLLAIEEDHLKSGLSGKTNYSRPQMAKASVRDFFGTGLLKGF